MQDFDSPIDYPTEYYEYFRLFNEGDFFEAHEVLEDLWVVETGEIRDYYKGLIMAAVAILHWRRGNASGARKLYRDASRYLRRFPGVYEGFELERFRGWLDEAFLPLIEDPHAPAPKEVPRLEIAPAA